MEKTPTPVKEKTLSSLGINPPLDLTPKSTPKPPTPSISSSPSPSVSTATATADVITIPSFSRWFSWDKVHESERRFLPEFFDDRSLAKNASVYMYYRNSIIKMFRENPSRKISFTHARKKLVGDVGSIRRVFDFLESWGLINYTGMTSKPQSKSNDKENRSSDDLKGSESSLSRKDTSTRFCSGCKTVCSIACFVCDKFDLTLCARCYVRGDYRVGVTSADDFRRVEISEQSKTDWSDKETLQLLEAVMYYGEEWKKVAEHVGGRSELECVTRFLKLPFKEQFIGPSNSEGVDKYYEVSTSGDEDTGETNSSQPSPAKKRRLTPFADTSNPIMAQVAFLSAIVGSGVAEAAAQGAVGALSAVNFTSDRRESTSATFGTGASYASEEGVAVVDAQKEYQDIEKSITSIFDQMKDLEAKIVHFEEAELQMEKEWKQLAHMKNLLFIDQLNILFQKATPSATGENTTHVKNSDSVT